MLGRLAANPNTIVIETKSGTTTINKKMLKYQEYQNKVNPINRTTPKIGFTIWEVLPYNDNPVLLLVIKSSSAQLPQDILNKKPRSRWRGFVVSILLRLTSSLLPKSSSTLGWRFGRGRLRSWGGGLPDSLCSYCSRMNVECGLMRHGLPRRRRICSMVQFRVFRSSACHYLGRKHSCVP